MYRLYNIYKFTTVSQKMYQGLLMSLSAKLNALLKSFVQKVIWQMELPFMEECICVLDMLRVLGKGQSHNNIIFLQTT